MFGHLVIIWTLVLGDRIRPMVKHHGHPLLLLTFLSAAALAGVFLLLTIRTNDVTNGKRAHTAGEIAVEHDAAATLTIHQSSGKNAGIIEFTGEGADLRLSTPSSWERREVRGAALAAVTSDGPSLGFTRWHVPEGVTLSFYITDSPTLSIHHPSQHPLLIMGKRVDIVIGWVEEKSMLMKEGVVRLW